MVRGQWRIPVPAIEQYYGLGIVSGSLGGWDWFGHSGGLQGYISRTCVLPRQELAISVLTNAIDGWADIWVDGAIHILRAYAENGAPKREVRDWRGRWWTLWGAYDLLPMGNKVIVAGPASLNPPLGAAEIEMTGPDTGRLASAGNYGSHGEPVRCVRAASGAIVEIWLAATKLLPGPELAREMEMRYGEGVANFIGAEPGVVVHEPARKRRRRRAGQATAPGAASARQAPRG
jgi:hypothetical protein